MPNSILSIILSAVTAMPSDVSMVQSVPSPYAFTTGVEGLVTVDDLVADVFGLEGQRLSNGKGDAIVSTAMQYIGARYRLGKTGPNQFDCSGFTSYVYKQEDIDLTRTSRSQFSEGIAIHDVCDLQKGDLVFFGGRRSPGRVGHVGIVTDVDAENGTFEFIHASHRGVVVDKSNTAYYSQRYLGARRIL